MNSGQYTSPPGMILSHYAVGFIVYTVCDFAWILPLPTEGCGEGEESAGVVEGRHHSQLESHLQSLGYRVTSRKNVVHPRIGYLYAELTR